MIGEEFNMETNGETKTKVAVQEEKIENIQRDLRSVHKRVARIEKSVYIIILILVGAGVINTDKAQNIIALITNFFV